MNAFHVHYGGLQGESDSLIAVNSSHSWRTGKVVRLVQARYDG